ncbi:MAG: hypothetical protein ACRDT4_11380, partial [Micromonosporaceae bacterium]
AAWIAVSVVAPAQPPGPPTARPSASAPAMTPMRPVGGNSLVQAELLLTDAGEGTKIEMTCRYGSAGGYEPGQRASYSLVVISRTGQSETVATWQVAPGEEPWIRVVTGFARTDLERIEIQRANGVAVLTYEP